jgi:hypothetical protein
MSFDEGLYARAQLPHAVGLRCAAKKNPRKKAGA